MSTIVNAAALYALLLVIFRMSGRRTLLQITTFDFVLLLIISEAAQGALVGRDASVTGGLLAILTLVMLDVALSLIKQRFPRVEQWVDGVPVVLIRRREVLTSASNGRGSISTTSCASRASTTASATWRRSTTPSSSPTARSA